MRVAIGGLSNESCSFSPLPSDVIDFTWLYGEALLERYPFLDEYGQVSALPLVWTRAIPGGPIRPQVYARFKREFLDMLRAALPLDGIYLDMHGAAFVSGMMDVEGDFLTTIRDVVGADCVIAASYDLHGNLSRDVAQHADIVTAYRTAPHIDTEQTRERAFRLLVRALKTGEKPYQRVIYIPVILPGEKTATTWEPGSSLYASLEDYIGHGTIWDASILVGYAWADEPRTSAAVVAIGTDPQRVDAAAVRLAQAYWDARHRFQFGTTADSIEICVRLAIDSQETPVFISDAGDNITGGGVGDVPLLLQALLDQKAQKAIVAGLVDSRAVAIGFEHPPGAVVELSLGGKLDTLHGRPLPVKATILRHIQNGDTNRYLIIRVDGVTVIVTERRTAFIAPDQFAAIGVHLADFHIVVLKLGYLSPEFSAMARLELLALSPGVIEQALETLDYQQIRRPIFPLDPDMTWQPEDGL